MTGNAVVVSGLHWRHGARWQTMGFGLHHLIYGVCRNEHRELPPHCIYVSASPNSTASTTRLLYDQLEQGDMLQSFHRSCLSGLLASATSTSFYPVRISKTSSLSRKPHVLLVNHSRLLCMQGKQESRDRLCIQLLGERRNNSSIGSNS